MSDGGENVLGIYMITNKLNGKRYIGRSLNIYQRFRGHCSKPITKWRSGKQSKLSYDINKFGVENFDVSILLRFNSLEQYYRESFYYEKYYMAELQPEYNIMFGCNGGGKTAGLNLDDEDYSIKARTNWDVQVGKFKSNYPNLEIYIKNHHPNSTSGKLESLGERSIDYGY